MSRVRVHNFSVSLDGYGTGEGQSLEAPFGHASGRLMNWFFGTRTFRAMHGEPGGEPGGGAGVDEAFASNWGPGIGAEIMGRNKFGPQRGPWEDEEWKGWWGDDPVFHTPVFVLTHHARPSIEMCTSCWCPSSWGGESGRGTAPRASRSASTSRRSAPRAASPT